MIALMLAAMFLPSFSIMGFGIFLFVKHNWRKGFFADMYAVGGFSCILLGIGAGIWTYQNLEYMLGGLIIGTHLAD